MVRSPGISTAAVWLPLAPSASVEVYEIHKSSRAIGISLEQSLNDQITNGYQHPIRLIVSVVLNCPVDGVNIQQIDISEKHQQFSKFFLPCFGNIRTQQKFHCRFDNPIHIRVF